MIPQIQQPFQSAARYEFPPETHKLTRCHEKQQEDDEGFLRFSSDTLNSRWPQNPSRVVETTISPLK